MKVSLLALLPLFAAAAPCFSSGVACPADSVDEKGLGKVLLFSALPLGQTPFAAQWAKVRKELTVLFPGLQVEKPENLHVTLSFMGAGWKPADADLMEQLALDGPDFSSGVVKLKGTPDLFGPKKHVVALRLAPVPAEWSARLMRNRDAMTAKGWRKRDMYDGEFSPHVSLVSASKPEEQRADLEKFRKWMSANAARFGDLEISFDKSIIPQFFVVIGKGEDVRFIPLRTYCKDLKDSPL